MASVSAIVKSRLKFNQPDFSETRKGKCLLIWGAIPYWIILDKDFVNFLENLNGEKSLDDVISSNSSWEKSRIVIIDASARFAKQGILTDVDAKVTKAKEKDEFIPIENISVNITNMCNLRCKFCFNLARSKVGDAAFAFLAVTSFVDSAFNYGDCVWPNGHFIT